MVYLNGTPQVDTHPNIHNTLDANDADHEERLDDLTARIAALEAVSPRKGDKGDTGGQGPAGPAGPRGIQGAPGVVNKLLDKDGNDVTAGTIQFLGTVEKVGGTLKVSGGGGTGGGGGGGGVSPVEPIESLNYPVVGINSTANGGFQQYTPAQSPDRSVYVASLSDGLLGVFNDDELFRYETSDLAQPQSPSPVVRDSGAMLTYHGNAYRRFAAGSTTGTTITYKAANGEPITFSSGGPAGGMLFGDDGFAYFGIFPRLDTDDDYKRLAKLDLSNVAAGATLVTDFQGMLAASGFTAGELTSPELYPLFIAGKENAFGTWALINTGPGAYKMLRRAAGATTWSVIVADFPAGDIAGFKIARPGAGDSFVWGTVLTGIDPDTSLPNNTYGVKKYRANGTVVTKSDLTPARSTQKGELQANRNNTTDGGAFGNVVELEENYFAIVTAVGTNQYDAPEGRAPDGVVPLVWLVNATGTVPTRQPLFIPEPNAEQVFNDEQSEPEEEVLFLHGAGADTTPDGTKHRITFTWHVNVGGLQGSRYQTDQVLVPVL